MKAIKLFLLYAILLSAVIGWFCYFTTRAEVNELKKEKYRYTCTFEGCNKAFETKHELMRHRKHNHPTFICTQCEDGKVWFNTQKELDWHTDTQHGEYIAPKSVERETPTTYKCDYCGKEFSSRKERHEHIAKGCPKALISEEEPVAETFDCDECNKMFTDESTLNAHKKKVHPKFKCTVKGCTREFSSRVELMTHRKNDHEIFTCIKCGNIWFNSKEELNGHMKARHGER